ncbi:hypothetical protein IFM89_008172, partial [Coptis chinensis]
PLIERINSHPALKLNQTRFLSNTFSSIPLESDDDLEKSKQDDLKTKIFKLRFSKRSVMTLLEKWVADGNNVTLFELRNIARDLNKSQRYKHALEISEWMVRNLEFELSDSDYGVRIDLMTKVFGIDAAERYFEGLPLEVKTGETYTSLLHSYAGSKMTERAENFFQRVQEENVSLNAMMYNEMMTLYMSVGQLEKVPSVIEDMKRRKVSPDLFTYNLWISACAANLDIDSVKSILDEMSCDPNSDGGWEIYRQLTSIYINAGNLVNSDGTSVVETERKITQKESITYDFLIILYTGLKNKEKINQIWKSLRMAPMKMTSRNYICVISSYLMLGHFKEVDEVFEQWKQSTTTDFDSYACSRLLSAVAGAGLVDKADGLRALMIQKNCNPEDEPH